MGDRLLGDGSSIAYKTGETWTTIVDVFDISVDASNADVDVTVLTSPVMEYKPGLSDGSISFSARLDVAQYATLKGFQTGKSIKEWKYVLPDDDDTEYTYLCYINSLSKSGITNNSSIDVAVTLKVCGIPEEEGP